MQIKRLSNTWANILLTIEHREHNKCLNGEMLHFYPLNELISNLMPATGLKKSWHGGNEGLKKQDMFPRFHRQGLSLVLD